MPGTTTEPKPALAMRHEFEPPLQLHWVSPFPQLHLRCHPVLLGSGLTSVPQADSIAFDFWAINVVLEWGLHLDQLFLLSVGHQASPSRSIRAPPS